MSLQLYFPPPTPHFFSLNNLCLSNFKLICIFMLFGRMKPICISLLYDSRKTWSYLAHLADAKFSLPNLLLLQDSKMATRIYTGNTTFSLTPNTLWAIYSLLSKGKRVLLSYIVLTNLIPLGRSLSSPPPLPTSFSAYSTWEGLVLAVVFRKPLHQSSLFKNKTKQKEFDAFTFKWHHSFGLSFTQWSTHI